MDDKKQNSPRLSGLDDLVRPFHEAETPRAAFRVGTEAEKFGLDRSLAPIGFDGETGVLRVLEGLASEFGWTPKREVPGAPAIALTRGHASITLEPAGQLELSGAPLPDIHATRAEMDDHLSELQKVSEPLGITWLGVGFHPLATLDALPRVPKLRYPIMERYLPTVGARGLDMMKRTCTVQANLDFASEADAMRKLRVSLRAQPLVSAMFANSPWYEGRHRGRVGERPDVWLHMDPARTGLLPFAWREGASYADYVEWALDAPMFLIVRDGRVVENTGQRFREFLADGWEGTYATAADWETHLNTLFPEVRLKRTLEWRGADNQRRDLVCALPALARGLLYDDVALEQAEALVSRFTYEDAVAARVDITVHGLRATLGGREVAEWADELLSIAEGGLDRLDVRDAHGRSERVHLVPVRALVDAGACPADFLRSALPEDQPNPHAVVELTRV
ncbi:MAG: glutamate-cysteine ligase family protein [Polyangiales bacterium]|nr:glutamate--cysteine ligase [Myxococcales bacterium]MCB9661413.1 glutamate--cysteine ligase [Sandaracinaceae bacterium]